MYFLKKNFISQFLLNTSRSFSISVVNKLRPQFANSDNWKLHLHLLSGLRERAPNP